MNKVAEKINYTNELYKVMKFEGEFIYRNCVVKRLVGGFLVLSQIAKNEQELNQVIDEAIGKLGKSIK